MVAKLSWDERRKSLGVHVSTVKPGPQPRGLTAENLKHYKHLLKIVEGSADGVREFLIARFESEQDSGPQQLAVQIIVRHKLQSLYVIPAAAQRNKLLDGTDYPEPTGEALVRHLQSHPVLKQRLDTTTVAMPADDFYTALEKADKKIGRRGFGMDEREGIVLLVLLQIFSRHIPFVQYTLKMLKHSRITGGTVIETLLGAVQSNKSLVTSPATTMHARTRDTNKQRGK